MQAMTSTRIRRLVAVLLVGMGVVATACTAEGGVDTEGDGVQINGDVDSTEEGE